MSLGINSVNSGGKLSVVHDLGKAKVGDLSRFNESIDTKVGEQQAKKPDFTNSIRQNSSKNSLLQLPDYSSDTEHLTDNSVDDEMHAPLALARDAPVFIEDLLQQGGSAGGGKGTPKSVDSVVTAKTEGFGVVFEAFDRVFKGSFNSLPEIDGLEATPGFEIEQFLGTAGNLNFPSPESSNVIDAKVEQLGETADDVVFPLPDSSGIVDNAAQLAVSTIPEFFQAEANQFDVEQAESDSKIPEFPGTFSHSDDDVIARFLNSASSNNDHYQRVSGFIG